MKVQTNASRQDRIDHIWQFMEWDNLTTSQLDLLESYERQWKARGHLSERQYEILEDIFSKAAEGNQEHRPLWKRHGLYT